MPPRIPPGTRSTILRPRQVAASTFVELVVTMLLLVMFAALAFPLFWGTNKATVAHEVENAALQSKLSLVTLLPRFTEEIRPPYWENPENVFVSSGTEWKVAYCDGDAKSFLVLRKESGSRLSLVTLERTISIDNLPGLAVDWWKKNGRTIGFTVSWRQGTEQMEFHSSWGSFLL